MRINSIKELRFNNFKLLPDCRLTPITQINVLVGRGLKENILTAINLLQSPFKLSSWSSFLLSDGEVRRVYRERGLIDSSEKGRGVRDLKYLFRNYGDRIVIEAISQDDCKITLNASYTQSDLTKSFVFSVEYILEVDGVIEYRKLRDFRQQDHLIPSRCNSKNFLSVKVADKSIDVFSIFDATIKPFLLSCLQLVDDSITDISCKPDVIGELYITIQGVDIPWYCLDLKTINFIKLVIQLYDTEFCVVTISMIEDYIPIELIDVFCEWLPNIIKTNNLQLFITTDNLDIVSGFSQVEEVTTQRISLAIAVPDEHSLYYRCVGDNYLWFLPSRRGYYTKNFSCYGSSLRIQSVLSDC
jgi:hypothetical protein